MDRGKTSVASLFIYIFNLMFNNIFSTSANIRAPRVFEFYGCRNVGRKKDTHYKCIDRVQTVSIQGLQRVRASVLTVLKQFS